MSNITNISAREILDSRGNPTVAVTVEVEDVSATCSVPSGVSTGSAEAVELRDGEERFAGQGVQNACEHVNQEIAETVVGMPVADQQLIDEALISLDATENKSRLGANAILGTSIAAAKVKAKLDGKPLAAHVADLAGMEPAELYPRILANLINGGEHADSGLAFQEFMISPRTRDPKEAIEIISFVQKQLKYALVEQYGTGSTGVGDEGGFAPAVSETREVLDILSDIIKERDVEIAIDAAANYFYKDNHYAIDGESYTASELIEYYRELATDYPIFYLEDPLFEKDLTGFAALKERIGAQVIGDDLTVTNNELIERAIEEDSIDGVIIKPNQIGTLTETIQAVKTAKSAGLSCYASHRSGETNDEFIVDIGIGLSCDGLKIGAMQRGERISKYNRLLDLIR